MPTLASPDFGQLEFLEEDILNFAGGVPAFEELRRFLLVEKQELEPFVFLVSVDSPTTRFICIPVCLLDPDYQFELSPDEGAQAGLKDGHYSAVSPDGPLVLAITTLSKSAPATVNLASPVVINAALRLGTQLILSGTAYSHVTPLRLCSTVEEAC